MQKYQEIKSNIDNIRYYVTEIKKLANEQFKLDFSKAQEKGVNASPGTVRYDCMAVIVMDCGLFETYLSNIEINLESAKLQDKILFDLSEDE